ncbi:Glutamyl-tRNA amidotransferase B subunit [Vararia minispora EC-137]|uniref:Glutamyl-tRNA amidotransferase B subunit n=1 Tax=Vararia minispora EC-137 TaxID=1314806 RepID=A0ACB8QMK3_9AGAM|nr:Glutamyl-tRNA amidotransferase B subunit [Vararia minispora EC-137]
MRVLSAHTGSQLLYDPKDARWPDWEIVVGIEVHAQIKSRHKIFSAAQTSGYEQVPNTHVSMFDASLPGTLPRLNPRCVDLAVRTALALDSDIQTRSTFDRKHYFYSDLPAGYQITQRYNPFSKGGYLNLTQSGVSVRIEQIQLEQDTAKTAFDARRRVLSIDLNRAGSGLMEIVSKPDMRSPEEAGDYVRSLQAILRAVGSSDGNMEQGSLRCDVNVSVNRPGRPPGTRCEIKNLNSIKYMMIAISAEVFRHISLLERGETVPQETRGFHEDSHETFKLRSKENSPDYRYMPDPNIPPLVLCSEYIERIRGSMPELPAKTRIRLIKCGLSDRDVDVLMIVDSQKEVGFDGKTGGGIIAYFDELTKENDAKIVVNWDLTLSLRLTHELLGQLTRRGRMFQQNTIPATQMGELIQMVQSGSMTGDSGKELLRFLLDNPSDKPAHQLADELALLTLQDSALQILCRDVVSSSPTEVKLIRKGNMKIINKLVGKVMKKSRGRADAQATLAVLEGLIQTP